MFGDSVYFHDHFPLVRKLLVRPTVAAFLVSTTSGVDALPTTTLKTQDDCILVWVGWKSLMGILLACLLVIVTAVVQRHLRREPSELRLPDDLVIDTGCQVSLLMPLDPVLEEADAPRTMIGDS